MSDWLEGRGHPHSPRWLETPARTVAEAATALGIAEGQVAKSIVFKRLSDGAPVLVVTSGDKRVDERKVAAQVGALGRADADFIKGETGFSIGGVAPVGHLRRPVALIDRELFRFDVLWAAAGHPHGIFQLSPAQLVALTGAPVADVVQNVGSPCNDICQIDPQSGWCKGCWRTREEIAAWSNMEDDGRLALLSVLPQRQGQS